MKFNFNIDDIKYVKVICRDLNNSPFFIKAAIKLITEREITVCMKYDEEFKIETPQEVTLSVICGDGLYRTKTKLKSYAVEPPYILFYMETPAGIEYQQNREYFRIVASYEGIYYVKTETETKNYSTKTVDLSANGVSIELSEHIFSEDDSELDIMVEERLIHTKIKYVRSEKTESGYKLSFTFVDLSNADRDYISQVCIKKQLEQKRATAS